MFWVLIALTIIFFVLAIRHSVGNVVEVINLLDTDKYARSDLQINYNMLREKWGEWVLFGDEGAGISVKYINVGAALFSGLMITYTTLTLIFFLLAIIIGKILLPMLTNMYKNDNDELIDITTLRTMEQVNELSGKKEKNKKTKKEWF